MRQTVGAQMSRQIYNIVIDEDQRLALLEVLRESKSPLLEDNQPLELWDVMLANLPNTEKEEPGVNHGFCY